MQHPPIIKRSDACLIALALVALSASVPVEAKPDPTKAFSRPESLEKLFACRAITDSDSRLACFDERVQAFDVAESKRDVVVVDREQIRDVRKSLFGLTLPNLKLFNGRSEARERADDDDVKEIHGVIARVDRVGANWSFTLTDGMRWQQTDGRPLGIEPEKGSPIRIRKAALGSYLANVSKQTAIRVMRVN